MLEWLRQQKDDSLIGLIALYSIFHLPRSRHIELFIQIYRVLKCGGTILFTVPPAAADGFQQNWLGAKQMYWSTFSVSWYELTLNELGFELISKHKDIQDFLGERETTWYLLYKKPEKIHNWSLE